MRYTKKDWAAIGLFAFIVVGLIALSRMSPPAPEHMLTPAEPVIMGLMEYARDMDGTECISIYNAKICEESSVLGSPSIMAQVAENAALIARVAALESMKSYYEALEIECKKEKP